MPTPDPAPARLLAIAAHPDDIDFGAGGTIARLAAAGTEVTYCVITDGDAGGFDPSVLRSEIPGIRRREQQAAAAVLGAKAVQFLGYRDGELTVSHGLRRDIARVIRQVRPDVAIVQTPVRNLDRMYASHPDHLAAGEAAMQAIYPDARNPFAHPSLLQDEGLEEWTVPQTWIAGYSEPDYFPDITAQLGQKVAALQAHESQTAHMDIEAMLRGWGGQMAQSQGLPEGTVCEGFKVLDTA